MYYSTSLLKVLYSAKHDTLAEARTEAKTLSLSLHKGHCVYIIYDHDTRCYVVGLNCIMSLFDVSHGYYLNGKGFR